MLSGKVADSCNLVPQGVAAVGTRGGLRPLPWSTATPPKARGPKAATASHHPTPACPIGPTRGPGQAACVPAAEHRRAAARAAASVLAVAARARGSVWCGGSSRAVAAASAAAGVAPSATNPSAAGAACSSDSSMDGDAAPGAGVVRPLVVVVAVVLLDDPEWGDGTAGEGGGPGAQAAAAAAPGAAISGAGDQRSEPPAAPGVSGARGQRGEPPAAPGVSGARAPVRVLLAQRPEGKANAGLWEFPGGKVDAGETPEAALVRELREELGITVQPADLQPLTFASHTYPTFHLLMPLYACRRWRGEPHGAEGQAVAWVAAAEVPSYSLTLADIPLVPAVLAAMEPAAGGLSRQQRG